MVVRSESDVIREVLAKGLREMILRDPRIAPGGGALRFLRKAQIDNLTFAPTPEQVAACEAAEAEMMRAGAAREAERVRAESAAQPRNAQGFTEEEQAEIDADTAQAQAKVAPVVKLPVAVAGRGAVSR